VKRRKGELRLGEFSWAEHLRTGASTSAVLCRLRSGDYGRSVRVRKENARVVWVTVVGSLPKLPADLRAARSGRKRNGRESQ
jgi:hypothetical protein